jgi:outer membrane lipoprotein-sorting protein
MAPSLKSSRAIRWAAPVGAIAVVGAALGTGPVIAAARGNPSLPPKTAAELLTAVQHTYQSGKLPPLSGTVVESASLGLPALPGGAPGATSPISLLSGSHTARVWYGDEQHVRLALLDTGSETDYIRNGADTWQWSSDQNTATHWHATGKPAAVKPHEPVATPQKAADQALAAIGKTTTISVDPTARVAGRAVYELVLSPKDNRSLIGQVRLALDGKTYVPLRVQVYARGSKDPAVQVGFTSVTLTKPAAANFDFKPPAGAKLVEKKPGTEKTPGAEKTPLPGQVKTPAPQAEKASPKKIGSGWTEVVQLTAPQNAQGKDKNGLMDAFQKAATPVHGDWGSGRVLRTKLFSVLLTDDGRVYAGAVTPDVLTQAAAHR